MVELTQREKFWAQLKPYIVAIENTVGSNTIRVKVHAPADLLMKLGRFYKFELSEDGFLQDDLRIYADAWYSTDAEMYDKIRLLSEDH